MTGAAANRVPGLAGIVLAAGGSTRLGESKQLLHWQGKTLVQHAVANAQAVCGAGVVVITGADAAAVNRSLSSGSGVGPEILHNPDWAKGMGSSLACAAGADLVRDAAGLLVMLCDQPGVTPADLVCLVNLWQTSPAQPAAAGYAGVVGPPAVLPASWLPQLAALSGDAGARKLLASAAAVSILELPAAAQDIDTPADLAKLATLNFDPQDDSN